MVARGDLVMPSPIFLDIVLARASLKGYRWAEGPSSLLVELPHVFWDLHSSCSPVVGSKSLFIRNNN